MKRMIENKNIENDLREKIEELKENFDNENIEDEVSVQYLKVNKEAVKYEDTYSVVYKVNGEIFETINLENEDFDNFEEFSDFWMKEASEEMNYIENGENDLVVYVLAETTYEINDSDFTQNEVSELKKFLHDEV